MKRSPVRVRASALGKGLDKLDPGEAAVVRLAVTGGRHAVGTVTKSLGAGVATIRFRRTNRGGLKPGSYRAAVTATPSSGAASVSVGTVTFAVRSTARHR
jgi:hypothetical protein